jgi:ribosomal protein S12 methylthiotransferase
VVAGRLVESHKPVDRRTLLPISPVQRPSVATEIAVPGHGWVPDVTRRRLDNRPVAPLKLASGCDRRCAFCAIPSFRGAFVSRGRRDPRPRRLAAGQGVRELFLVSENSTSYGKDLGDLRCWRRCCPSWPPSTGIDRVRVSYLQPAETRPGLVEVIAGDRRRGALLRPVLPARQRVGAAPDAPVRLGGELPRAVEQIRKLAPEAGIRSNVIVGFPGETEADLETLSGSSPPARLDAVGVFGYSDEDGTEAAEYPDKVPAAEVAERVARLSSLAEELTNQRAEDRIGTRVSVLVEELGDPDAADADGVEDGEAVGVGRAAHQAPDVDGECVLTGGGWTPGELVDAVVLDSEGVDLVVARAGQR